MKKAILCKKKSGTTGEPSILVILAMVLLIIIANHFGFFEWLLKL